MPLPQIAIEIAAPADARGSVTPSRRRLGAAAAREALLASCAAAAAAECVTADAAAKPAILALVFWRGSGHVRIEVGSASRSAPWAVRELEFGERDPAVETWRTIGYTVGLLAGEALSALQPAAAPDQRGVAGGSGSSAAGGAAPSAPGEENRAGATGAGDTSVPATESAAQSAAQSASATPSAVPEPAPPVPVQATTSPPDAGPVANPAASGAASRPWWVGAGGVVGPGIGSIRGGGFLRASRAFGAPFATAALAYSVDARDARGISAQRLTLSAGGGYELVIGASIALDLRAELVAEQLVADVDEPASGRSDAARRWVAAFSAGAELYRPLFGPIGIVVGLETTLRTNRTDIQLHDARVATAPFADLLVLAGVRFVLP